MIESISFKNVFSFRDEVELSFEAAGDSASGAHVAVMPNGTRLLRLGIVLGANASGKSNLLKAIDRLRAFWFREPKNMDSRTPIEPFLLDRDTPNQSSEYSIKFWTKGIRYWYQLSVTRNRVISEKLSYYKTTQPIFLFDRQLEGDQSVLRFNPKVQSVSAEEQKALSLYCLPNMSFFAARGKVNTRLEYIDDARDWMRDSIMPLITPGTSLMHYGHRKLAEDADFKQHLLSFLYEADFNITGLISHVEERVISESVRRSIMEDDEAPEELKQHILERHTMPSRSLGFQHTVENERGRETYELTSEQQSDGTRRTMGIEAAVYEAARGNAFLCVDELEASLHPDLLEYIIQQFMLQEGEGQLLFTTHYDPLLKTIDDLIRKDNVWFVEKQPSGSSDLYALIEFKGLNKMSSVSMMNAYRNGRFGALPEIKG